jgi:hypothetical protein
VDEPGPLLVRITADGLEDLRRASFDKGPPDRMERIGQNVIWTWMRGVQPMPPGGFAFLDIDAVVNETLDALIEAEICSPLGLAKTLQLLEGSIVADGGDPLILWNH